MQLPLQVYAMCRFFVFRLSFSVSFYLFHSHFTRICIYLCCGCGCVRNFSNRFCCAINVASQMQWKTKKEHTHTQTNRLLFFFSGGWGAASWRVLRVCNFQLIWLIDIYFKMLNESGSHFAFSWIMAIRHAIDQSKSIGINRFSNKGRTQQGKCGNRRLRILFKKKKSIWKNYHILWRKMLKMSILPYCFGCEGNNNPYRLHGKPSISRFN